MLKKGKEELEDFNLSESEDEQPQDQYNPVLKAKYIGSKQ